MKTSKGGRVMERLTKRDSYGDVYVKQHDYVTASERIAECEGFEDFEEIFRKKMTDTASERLCEYEDLEEQGLLLRLPCKVGSTVYAICTCEAVGTVLDGTLYGSNGGFGTATGYYCPYELSDKCPHIDIDDCDECKNIESVFEDTIDYINITEYEVIIGLKNTNLCVTIDEIGKTVFLTKAEAEQKLKEMECD